MWSIFINAPYTCEKNIFINPSYTCIKNIYYILYIERAVVIKINGQNTSIELILTCL